MTTEKLMSYLNDKRKENVFKELFENKKTDCYGILYDKKNNDCKLCNDNIGCEVTYTKKGNNIFKEVVFRELKDVFVIEQSKRDKIINIIERMELNEPITKNELKQLLTKVTQIADIPLMNYIYDMFIKTNNLKDRNNKIYTK